MTEHMNEDEKHKVEQCVIGMKHRLNEKNPRTGKPYQMSDLYAICTAAVTEKKSQTHESNLAKAKAILSDCISQKSEESMVKDFIDNSTTIKTFTKDIDGKPTHFFEIKTSGTKLDREGERMSQGVVDSIIAAHKSGKIPAFSNHGLDKNGHRTYRWQEIIGKFVDARQEGENVVSTLQLNMSHPEEPLLWAYANEGMPFGASIGARTTKKHDEEETK